MIIDKLHKAVRDKGFVCVGLDSHLDYVPSSIRSKVKTDEDAIFEYNKAIIDCTYDETAVYKLQIAYYEAMGLAGLSAYSRTLKYLRDRGLLSIADVKRGDIAATAKEYARAHFSGDFEADFMTLSPYMGFDSITPYLDYIKNGEKGVFVLMRTSNPGAKDLEYLMSDGKPVYYHLGDGLQAMADECMGDCGFSAIGMVVGGTHSEEAVAIRKRYPKAFFLIPGYGAQGGKPEDIRTYLGNFDGGVVNSSRGIITAYKKCEDGDARFQECTRAAVLAMKADIYGR